MSPFEAFHLGLKDRMAGLPMIARVPDEPELNDAYAIGYDPHDEMGLCQPQFAAQVAAFVRECCPDGVPSNLPRNRCEFPEVL